MANKASKNHQTHFLKAPTYEALKNQNLSLYSLYYAEACNELVGPISMSLRLLAAQLLSKQCRSGGELLATLCQIYRSEI